MKTKILMLLITAAIVLCSCSPKKEICSVDSCSQEVYKDGLCADHYVSATLSESNSDESSAEDIDPVVAALQEQYQEYVDEAISLCRDSLKNPKSLDIYNIYLADESINPYLPQMEVCIDAFKIQASNDIPVNPVPVPKIPCYAIAKNGLYDLLSQRFSIAQIKNPLAVS